MTTTELNSLIGTTRLLTIENQQRTETIQIQVKVLDAKTAFGRVNLVVEPVNGSGTMTVALSRTEEIK